MFDLECSFGEWSSEGQAQFKDLILMNPQETLKAAKAQHDEKVTNIVSEVLKKYQTEVAFKGGLCHEVTVGGYYNHLAVSTIDLSST